MNQVVRTSSKGFLSNLMGSIASVPIGILLFLASFVVLFKSEGCTNFAEVARSSVEVSATEASGQDGNFVSVTGELSAASQIADPDFLKPGDFISLFRNVEQYVWIESSSSETRDKVGGGTETVTTYSYEMGWTNNPQNSSNFEQPAGHSNPPQRIQDQIWKVDRGAVGVWSFVTADMGLPAAATISLSPDMLLRPNGNVVGGYLYVDGTAESPQLGDHRISWSALPASGTYTAFGLANGSELRPYEYETGETWLSMRAGSRDTAISTYDTEHSIMMWLLRLGGFLMMWIGMQMVFAPLHAVAGILPFLKKGSTFIVNMITFPVAFVLTVITIIVAKIFHSLIAMIAIGVLLVGGLLLGFKLYADKKNAGPAAPPMGPPPGAAPPMGPPPSAPPAA